MASRRRKPLPTISSSTGFEASSDLSAEDFKSLTISCKSQIPQLLLGRSNWNGGAIGVVYLNLSPDNNRVGAAGICLFGSLLQDKQINVSSYWSAATATSLTINIPNLSVFSFPENTLVSDYVSSSNIGFQFKNGDQPLATDQLQDAGVSEFCLRAYVYPTSASYARVQMVLFPSSELDLAVNPLYLDERFPGMQLSTFEFPFGPTPSLSPLQRSWGFPFVPAIIPGSTWEDSPTGPSGCSLRLALTALLRSARVPKVKVKLSRYLASLQELQLDPTKITDCRLPGIRWPSISSPSPPASEGWLNFLP